MAITKSDARQWPLAEIIRFTFDDLVSGTPAAIADLAGGEMITGGSVTVVTAWNSATTATLSLGDADLATRYANAVDLKATGHTPLTLTGTVQSVHTELLAAFTETGAAATAGEAIIEFTVVREGRQSEVA